MKIPTFDEAAGAISNNKYTPLDLFIFQNEPMGQKAENEFRMQLKDVLDYIINENEVIQAAIEWYRTDSANLDFSPATGRLTEAIADYLNDIHS